ncbi:MAG: PilT/PilU family type 4a pilus ATPase [Hydrogenoanaerobacterium sp.]
MDLEQLIIESAAQKVSDIHLICGLPPMLRLDGEITPMQDVPPLTDEDCTAYARMLAGDLFDKLEKICELDLARSFGSVRIRINIFRQQGHFSAALRILNEQIPALKALGLPPAVLNFPSISRGIVLVTGETGSGKSTTLAAILNCINTTRQGHIITLEDPIEYIHKPVLCAINQREVGSDTASYADGLRAVLREDPDVILIGEMRDLITIETALTAAETGHLVFATLHTCSAADSIDRIVDVFPAERQGQVRMQLSITLQAVLSQQLLPKKSGGRIAACEVMVVSSAIRNLIRGGKTPQIANSLATSAELGSISMDNALLKLLREAEITQETAISAAHDQDYVKKSLPH